MDNESTEPKAVRYYWCVNCGHHGDFGFWRQRGIKCEKCEYEVLASYSWDEWDEIMAEREKYRKYYEDVGWG